MKANVFLSVFLFCCFTSLRANSSQHEIDKRVEKIIQEMTLEEKLDYIGGFKDFCIRPIPRLKIPELRMADGPLGVRKNGPATSFPASILIAASWDKNLAKKVGKQLGIEAASRDVHILLAPGMNICRFPLCGRNFEYFGEDPYLSSQMAVHMIKGIQSQNVIATAKHFAANNQEWNRHQVSSDIDERTLREIYLPAFEASIKKAKAGAVMNSYNLINGVHASEYGYLNNEILKKEWGFQGILMSDWISTYDGFKAAIGGLDIEMPSGKFMNRQNLYPQVENKSLPIEVIDDKVRRILKTAAHFGFLNKNKKPAASLFHQNGRKIALKAALSGMVLLKNKKILPLQKEKLRTIAVIGPEALPIIAQGGGSSCSSPIIPGSFLSGISDEVGGKVNILYSRGTLETNNGSQSFDASCFKPALDSNETGFHAEYFDNSDFQGKPSHTRTDYQIKFIWKERSYRLNGPVNNYSVRWTGTFSPKIETDATFYVSACGRFRLYLDDLLILNKEEKNESFQFHTLKLEKDKNYKIRLEYSVDKTSQAIDFGVVYGKNDSISHAKKIAAQADAVILCVGFDAQTEGEDWDRPFKLPANQNKLIKAVLQANKKTVVVVTSGANISMSSWIDQARAVLFTWYPGQEGGRALAKILFGKKNPSGKLPLSFERHLKDNPCYKSYYDQNDTKRVSFSEGLFLGYRHFDQSSTKPLFPFGFGLSYTKFRYKNLRLKRLHHNQILLTFDITNIGHMAGHEVAQVYVSDDHSKVVRPLKELKGFAKLFLKPGETKSAKILLNERAFSYYDVDKKKWTYDPGDFHILVGSSSERIRLKKKINLE